MKKYKSAIIVLLCLVLIIDNSYIYAENESTNINLELKDDDLYTVGEIGGYLVGNTKTVNRLYYEKNFQVSGGVGFAFEEANNLNDIFAGKKTKVVGKYDENGVYQKKNGADRLLIDKSGKKIYIQDKCYATASESVDAAFDTETGMYRYVNDDGPMQLSVPKDQHEKAVELMKQKIADGKVSGITDVEEAENLVRESQYTRKQIVNITKAFNKDSIIYDAKTGIISTSCVMGITFVLDYASYKMNGESNIEALKNAGLHALQTGAVVEVTYVISSQLAKTSLKTALAPVSESIVKCFGEDFAKELIEKCSGNATTLTGDALIKSAGEALSRKIIVNTAIIAVLSLPDVIRVFRGRISTKQFIKNLSITLASIGGAEAGAALGGKIGSTINPGAGTIIGIAGGFILGTATGYAAKKAADYIYEGDSQIMYDIVTEEFQKLSEEYLVSENEADAIVESIKDIFTAKVLQDMFASDDRNKYAYDLMKPYFDKEIEKREKISLPSEEELRLTYKDMFKGIIYIH